MALDHPRQGFTLPLFYLEPGERGEPESLAVYLGSPDPMELSPGHNRVTKGVQLTPGQPRPPTMTSESISASLAEVNPAGT
jgi:hypothetical protein